MIKPRITAVAAIFAAMLNSIALHADDTEIYVGNTTGSEDGVFPNVLFDLDTSGSMSDTDGTGQTRLQRMKDALVQTLEQTSNVNVGLMQFYDIEGGPILYPLSYIDEVVEVETTPVPTSAVVPILAATDDAEEDTADGTMILDSEMLEMVQTTGTSGFGASCFEAPLPPLPHPDPPDCIDPVQPLASSDDAEDGGGGDSITSPDLDIGDSDVVGIRFPGVAIPQGATIVSARLTLTDDGGGNTSTLDLMIEGEDVGNSTPFTTPTSTNLNDTTRPRTAADVAWANVPAPSSNTAVQSPQIRDIIQEIIDRGDWASGNALSLLIEPTAGSGNRAYYSFDGAGIASRRPTLDIKYVIGATGFERFVSQSSDDAEERASNGDMDLNDDVLDMTEESGNTQLIGVRFQNINVPQGAVIHYAEMEFEIDDENTTTTNLLIKGHDTDSASTFTNSDDNISNRTTTSAQVSWPPVGGNFSVLAPNDNQPLITPDMSGIVQEIVDRAGWADGNAMAFIITGSGLREVESRDEDQEPLLRIWYSVNTPPVAATTQQVGLRFTGVNIPQGSTITDAFIDFQVGEASTEDTSLTVCAENVDNANGFSATDNDISGRSNLTCLPVASWTPGSWNTPGEVQQSPDLATLVQTVVDRAGWCGGNAMSFIISGSGRRVARAYEFDPSDAPVLRVNFNAGSNPGCSLVTATSQVQSSNDDAEQGSNDSVNLGSSDLELMYDGSVQDAVGMRFTSVHVPQGATVSEAYISFTADESHSGSTSVVIKGEDQDNATAFNSSDNDITGRTTTTASVAWDSLPAWNTGETHDTPDLDVIVQEIVNRTGWVAGNAMGFIIEPGTGCNSSSCRRTAESYDGSPAAAPRLVVKYQTTGIHQIETTVRDELISVVNNLNHAGRTPIVDTLFEAARYYRGEGVYYGKTRGAGPTYEGSVEDWKIGSEDIWLSHPDSYAGDATIVRGSTSNPITVDEDDLCYTDPGDEDCESVRITSNHDYISPITHECQANYLVLLSDGRANENHSETPISTMAGSCDATISELDSTTLAPTGSERNPDSAEQCGVDLIEYLHDNDQSTVDGTNIVQTFTIGFNLNTGSDLDAVEFLTEMAEVGEGTFYQASSSDELAGVFQNIITTIKKESTAFAAPGLAVNAFNRLFNRNNVYLALFEPASTVGWPGNIKKFALCEDVTNTSCEFGELIDKNGDPAVITDETSPDFGNLDDNAIGFWSNSGDDGLAVTDGGAGEVMPAWDSRNVYLYTNASAPDPATNPNGLAADMEKIESSDYTGADTTTSLKQRLLEAENCGGTTAPDNDCLNSLLTWILGKKLSQTDLPKGDSTEDRWAIADPMHSRPLVLTYGAETCTSTEIADSGSDCFGLTTSDPNPDKHISKLVVGTNAGGIHLIDENTGVEDFMVLSQESLDIQDNLQANPGGDHLYGMDSSPTARLYDCNGDGSIDPGTASSDCNGDGSINGEDTDFVHFYMGMRRGGRDVFAYNITPDSKLTSVGQTGGIAPKLIWRIDGGSTTGFSKLGQTWSEPKPTRIAFGTGVRTVLIFGGGYDTSQDNNNFGTVAQGNAIFIVDADTGELLWSASNDGSGATLEITEMQYSIPTEVALVDSTGDKLTNRLYVADTGGQVWRVDLKSTLSESTAARLAVLSDGTVDADKRKFFYQPEVALVTDVFFADEDAPDYDAIAIASGDRANPVDTTELDRIYLLRDYLINDTIALDGNNDPTNYPKCNATQTCNVPLSDNATTSDLLNVTDLLILDGTDDESVDDEPIDQLQASHGWYIDLENAGEKAFSKAVVIAGVLYVTTYLPIPDQGVIQGCSINVGESRLYAVDLFTGSPVFFDFNGSPGLQKDDRYRHLGTGPSAELVPVFLEGGTTGLQCTGAGCLAQELANVERIKKTFWYQRQ